MTPMKWFCSFLKEYRPRIILGFLLVTVMAALAIISPRISGLIVDQVIQGGNYGALPGLLAVLLGRLSAEAFCVLLSRTISKPVPRGSCIR